MINMKTRPYVMKARADSAQQTHQRILRATADLFWEKLSPEIRLDDVAARAGVTVQTILRHFSTREKLFEAVERFARQAVVEERAVPPGDIPAAITTVFDHYERRGDAVLRLLGQEFWDERIRAITDNGRRAHREGGEQGFEPHLAALPSDEREELNDLLVVATDVYTWKLLRRDRALERPDAEERVRRLIGAILAGKRGD